MFGAVDTQPINQRVEVLRRNMSFRLLTMMSLEHMCGGFILSVVVMLLMVAIIPTFSSSSSLTVFSDIWTTLTVGTASLLIKCLKWIMFNWRNLLFNPGAGQQKQEFYWRWCYSWGKLWEYFCWGCKQILQSPWLNLQPWRVLGRRLRAKLITKGRKSNFSNISS